MAVDKLVDSTQLDADLTSVANAIRTKGGTGAQLAFPTGFVSAVQAIPTGTTPSGTKQISITENGTVTEDVAAYANAEITVNVSGGGLTWDNIADPDGLTGAAVFLSATTLRNYAFAYSKITSISSQSLTRGGEYAFQHCQSLVSADFPSITELKVSMFIDCTALQSVHFPEMAAAININCFKGCTSLQTAVFPKAKTLTTSCFQNCTTLTAVDVGGETGTVNGIDNNAFNGDIQLTTLVMRNTADIRKLGNISAFAGTPFASGGTGGTIYIPKALYDHLGDGTALDYKAATNWSVIDGYGTITWAQIEGSQYENYYADGTPII